MAGGWGWGGLLSPWLLEDPSRTYRRSVSREWNGGPCVSPSLFQGSASGTPFLKSTRHLRAWELGSLRSCTE